METQGARESIQVVLSYIESLEAEVDRRRLTEATNIRLQNEVAEYQHQVNKEREKNARLKDTLEEMATDMSLMENRILELEELISELRESRVHR